MNRIIKGFAAFIVSICLILAPPLAYANTSVGGWTATDTIIAGANTTINAVKNGANGALKSAITVAPSASKLGKFLLKGGGTAALLLAVPQLLGDGVDWVLDPENNRIKYTSIGELTPSTGSRVNISIQKFSDGLWYFNKGGSSELVGSTPNEVCSQWVYSSTQSNAGAGNITSTTAKCYYYPAGVSAPPADEKYLPIDTVAAQVISNAAAGDVPSQDAVKATALEGFSAGEHDIALDASAIPDTGVENPPDTDNPPTDESLPFDDSSILSAIASLKAAVVGLLSSVGSIGDTLTQFYDWATADPQLEEPEEYKPEIGDPTKYDSIDLNQGYVTASGQCPAAADLSLNFGVVKLSYEPLCIILDKLSGVIVAVAYISVGFMIIRTV